MSRIGIAGQTITLGARFYDNGVLYPPYSVGPVEIYDAATGGTLITTLNPVAISTGYYRVSWDTPSTLAAGNYYDSWNWCGSINLPSTSQRFSFSVTAATEEPVAPGWVIESDAVTIVACRESPTWVSKIGIAVTQDLGNGSSMQLSWSDALPVNYLKQIHYNLYYSNSRFGVFDENPKAITAAVTAIVNVDPGIVNYFAVRATEFSSTELDITQLDQIGLDVYAYPDAQVLQADIDAYGATVEIGDATGFPDHGILWIDSELLYYSQHSGTTFVIADVDRGFSSTTISEHVAGAVVNLWHGFEDGNSNIQQSVADWTFENPAQNTAAIGLVNSDEDGYRAALENDITTNLTASDENTADFPGYDYTGYHRQSIQDTFRGDSCLSSYLGGVFAGERGFNFQDRMLSQLDMMLQVTGEPVIILRRKWTGRRCSCMGLRREHQRSRCFLCHGTGFLGGFDRLYNMRPISEAYPNDAGMFMMRFYPYKDDVDIVQDQGLRSPDELVSWSLTIPTIFDRDVIVKYTEDGIEEFRYIVLSVTRNKLLFSKTGKQEILMRRLDKTDQIYQIPLDDQAYWVRVGNAGGSGKEFICPT